MDNSPARTSYRLRGMVRASVSLAVGVAIASVVLASTSSGAVAQASQTLDRTYRCLVGVDGGIRSVNVWAQTGVGDRTKWTTPPHFLLDLAHGSGVRVWAGRTVSKPSAASWKETFYVIGCARASAPVTLSPRGLTSGGRASPFGDRYQCPAPRTVLVRVRVQFVRRASVGQTTRVPVRTGALAVRTTSGRPIAYTDVTESGRARVFAAPSCVPE